MVSPEDSARKGPTQDGLAAGPSWFLPQETASTTHRHTSGYLRLVSALVRHGHGIEALCFFLSLPRDALSDLVIQLDLPTPVDAAFRARAGLHAWTQDDYGRLFTAWADDWRCGAIAETLGRSKSSVWAKARRLGLPGRDRRSLCQPATIAPARPRQLDLFDRSPALDAWPPPPHVTEWWVRGTDERVLAKRKRGRGDLDWTKEFREHFEKRAFSGQRNQFIARDLGISLRAVSSMKCQMHITMPRELLRDDFDLAAATRNIAELRYSKRPCRKNPQIWFWRKPQDPRIARRDRPRGDCIA